ncbi:STAS domain-containing protein [Aneurinibacillus tyrosinisolvens]|uniref:STAS domain-containing protein n=1 Tax=Aneurinibacillus tyrosinisolvens TaxID=1443435 RepID=UPI00063F8CAB|nr:STAS domain-containing protein [Aneurinibacillus tyrosinisolvens]
MIQEVKIVNNQVHVALSGNIYVEESSAIREQLLQYIEKGHKDFRISLTAVHYIDSSGLGVLVAIHKRAVQNGGGVVIEGLHGAVRELFELTRLTRVFKIV